MARGVNKAIIVGTLGKDPEIKYTAGGSAIANLSVATSQSWKDKSSGKNVEKTEWHRIVIFGKLAEIAAQYLKKGSQAYFEGKIQTRKWQDQSGSDRFSTEIVANELQMLGGREKTGQGEGGPFGPTLKPHDNQTGGIQQDEPASDGFDDIPFADPYKNISLIV